LAEREIQPLLLGIYGIEVTDEMVRLFKETGAVGVCLQRRNIETLSQVRALVDELESRLGAGLLVAVEHEGGVVCRFARGVTFFPGNAALGKCRTPEPAFEVGKVMARELASAGINVNLAPILDLTTAEYNPDLALRAFGGDPRQASDMGAEMIRGLQEGHVSATARHFPGRGSGVGKSGRTVLIGHSREDLLARDLVPFRVAIAAGVDLVMTANAVYPVLDPEQPAMLSPKVVTDILRREMGFHGVAVTEDISSPWLLNSMSVEEAAVRAIMAGNDLVFVGSDMDLQRRAWRGLKMAGDTFRIPQEHLNRVQARLKTLLKRKDRTRSMAVAEVDDHGASASLAERIAAAAVDVVRDPQGIIPIPKDGKVGVLFPRLWDVADRVMIDDELRGAAGLVQGWIQEQAPSADIMEIPVQPEGELVNLTLEWAAGLETLVFFCYDAHRFSGQRRLIEELQRRSKKVVVVVLRNPWDSAFLGEKTSVIQTFGFRVPQLAAAVRLLFGPAAG
jgi:beta-N-acetylhexosaminidase